MILRKDVLGDEGFLVVTVVVTVVVPVVVSVGR